MHELDLEPLFYGVKWSVETICEGHVTDFKEYLRSRHPDLAGNAGQFKKYLNLEVHCRARNLINSLAYLDLGGREEEYVKRVLESQV